MKSVINFGGQFENAFCLKKISKSIISEFTTVDDNSPRFHPMPLHHLRPGRDLVLALTQLEKRYMKKLTFGTYVSGIRTFVMFSFV